MLYSELIKVSMQYLYNFGLKWDTDYYDFHNKPVTIHQDDSYKNISYYASDLLKIKLWPDDITDDYLLYTYIPRLVHESFFILGSKYYIPSLYISDEPIVLKAKSISIYSLFQPISIYFEDNRVTFMQDNYELRDFMQLLIMDWNEDNIKLIENSIKLHGPNRKSETELCKLFSSKLKCEADPVKIKAQINRLIFDNWTYELYETYYGLTPSIDMIMKIAFDRLIDGFQPKFANLKYKRLMFIEQLMKEFFKRISLAVAKVLLKGKTLRQLSFPINGFATHFHTNLHNQSFYDTVNGFSSILAHKATFRNPGASSKLPKSVADLHESHKYRICSNTIGNDRPGQMVSLVPDQKVDTRFGIFEKNHYKLKHFK